MEQVDKTDDAHVPACIAGRNMSVIGYRCSLPVQSDRLDTRITLRPAR